MNLRTTPIITTLLLLQLIGSLARAQVGEQKFEAGAQLQLLQQPSRTLETVLSSGLIIGRTFPAVRKFDPGFGGRIGYNLTPHIGVEGEVDWISSSRSSVSGNTILTLFGAKAGTRQTTSESSAKSGQGGRIPVNRIFA